MEHIIYVLTKQFQLIEIELYDYKMNRKDGRPTLYSEEYYAKLAHAYKGLKYSLISLQRTLDKEDKYVH